MYDQKAYSPGTALFALTILAILQIPTDGRPSDTGGNFSAPAVNQTDARHTRHPTLPVGQPTRLDRSQPPSWVF